jgi:hypothetical protein
MASTTKYWKYGVPITSVDSWDSSHNGGDYWKYGIPILRYDGGEVILTEGSTSWGQSTGTQEGNIRTFSGNWTGTGFVSGSGNNEKMYLSSLGYMESEVVNTGANSIDLYQNRYSSGNTGILKYRSGSSVVDCQAGTWLSYTGSFASLGYTQVRVEGRNKWWLANGVVTGDVIAAYEGKGALSYEASKVNLANPGTNDSYDNDTPVDWDTVNGWDFSTNNWLDTSITITQLTTFMFKFKDRSTIFLSAIGDEYYDNNWLWGTFSGDANNAQIDIGFGNQEIYYNNVYFPLNGVFAINYDGFYLDGELLYTWDSALNSFSRSLEFHIGAFRNGFGDYLSFVGYGIACALYNKTLTQSQIKTIGNAMP